MITILSTESSRIATNVSFNTREDIEEMTNSILGANSKVVYRYNIPACAELIRGGDVHGLVIPMGHGDHNTLRNLECHLGKVIIPVFNAYKIGYAEIGEQYRKWLKQFL